MKPRRTSYECLSKILENLCWHIFLLIKLWSPLVGIPFCFCMCFEIFHRPFLHEINACSGIHHEIIKARKYFSKPEEFKHNASFKTTSEVSAFHLLCRSMLHLRCFHRSALFWLHVLCTKNYDPITKVF